MTEQRTTEPLRAGAEPAPWGALTIADDLCLAGLGETQFGAIVLAQGIPHTAEAQWATAASSLDPVLPHARTTARSAQMQSALLDLEPLFGEQSVALVTLAPERRIGF